MHAELSPAAAARLSARATSPTPTDEAQVAATAPAIDPGDAEDDRRGRRRSCRYRSRSRHRRLRQDRRRRCDSRSTDGKIAWDASLVFPGLEEGERARRRRSTLGDRAADPRRRRHAARRGRRRLAHLAARQLGDRRRRRGRRRPRPSCEASSAARASRRAPRSASADWSSPSTRASRASPAASCSSPMPGVAEASRGCSAQPSPSPASREDDDRPGPPGDDGRRPRRPLRRRRRARRHATAHVRALGGHRLLRPAAAGIDLQDHHHRPPRSRRSRSRSTTSSTCVQAINAGGRVIDNANEEFCGGSFVESFAHSCNTVFAPLGVEVGDEKLVEIAERFGFNSDADRSTTTAATEARRPARPDDPGPRSRHDVDLAASAIGQGQVLATPLAMATISQTIANGGMRKPTLDRLRRRSCGPMPSRSR